MTTMRDRGCSYFVQESEGPVGGDLQVSRPAPNRLAFEPQDASRGDIGSAEYAPVRTRVRGQSARLAVLLS